MKIYIASHDRWAALFVASEMEKRKHEVVSRWIYNTFDPTEKISIEDRRRIAKEDADDVVSCDVLILVSGRERYPGGKFVEVGIALGLEKKIIILGDRENMLMWHPGIKCVSDLNELSL